MAISEDYVTYLHDQLADLGPIEGKKMFGGYGFFQEGKMFAMVGHGAFRLKVDDTNRQDYLDHGMEPFHSGGKKKGMPYWEVPAEVIENRDELTRWARKSVAIAHSA